MRLFRFLYRCLFHQNSRFNLPLQWIANWATIFVQFLVAFSISLRCLNKPGRAFSPMLQMLPFTLHYCVFDVLRITGHGFVGKYFQQLPGISLNYPHRQLECLLHHGSVIPLTPCSFTSTNLDAESALSVTVAIVKCLINFLMTPFLPGKSSMILIVSRSSSSFWRMVFSNVS